MYQHQKAMPIYKTSHHVQVLNLMVTAFNIVIHVLFAIQIFYTFHWLQPRNAHINNKGIFHIINLSITPDEQDLNYVI